MPHWLVIDLEATTDDGGWPLEEMEVIEIGASVVTRAGREVDQFQRVIRPQRRPLLTPFCRQLTRITQAKIDAAASMPLVWEQFERWLGQHLPTVLKTHPGTEERLAAIRAAQAAQPSASAPLPLPPCIRHRAFPFTAGDRQG